MVSAVPAHAVSRVWLVDNQLPVALARHLDASGIASLHVSDIDLDRADDLAIWRFAQDREWVIVSKDEDFQDLSVRYGPPPQLVWVRLGNCRKAHLLQVFDHLKGSVFEALAAGEAMMEVVDSRP